MKDGKTTHSRLNVVERKPYRIHLPGFVQDDHIGLGDVIKRVTNAIGIKPCGGCEKRAEILNHWMVFSR